VVLRGAGNTPCGYGCPPAWRFCPPYEDKGARCRGNGPDATIWRDRVTPQVRGTRASGPPSHRPAEAHLHQRPVELVVVHVGPVARLSVAALPAPSLPPVEAVGAVVALEQPGRDLALALELVGAQSLPPLPGAPARPRGGGVPRRGAAPDRRRATMRRAPVPARPSFARARLTITLTLIPTYCDSAPTHTTRK
jgi:hypothetical protein